ncbi:MAG: hypothetical protein K0R28_30 [Paenibacillus sp.]|nr:hypothetical protein [Paenibacillus sp.]
MEPDKRALEKKKHLFRVEIMVEESNQTMALSALLQILNHPMVNDFRIAEGIQFGKAIEKTVSEGTAQPFAIPPNRTVSNKNAAAGQSAPSKEGGKPKSPKQTPEANPASAPAETGTLNLENLTQLKESGTLVRIVVVKGKGVKLSLPCRILNFDPEGQQLTIYHVDEKKVYSFTLNEIEDIIM